MVHRHTLPVATLVDERRARRQAVTLRDETWQQDIDALLRVLQREPTRPDAPSRRRQIAGGRDRRSCVLGAAWRLFGGDPDTPASELSTSVSSNEGGAAGTCQPA